MKEHPKERQTSRQSSEPDPLPFALAKIEKLQDWKPLNSEEALSGKQTPFPLTQPSAMLNTSALMVFCRLCLPGAKSPLD